MARLTSPNSAITPSPVYHLLPEKTVIVRLFNPTSHGATATGFRDVGPISRFDHHRATAGGGRTVDPDRRVIYGGLTLSCCLVEVFGDIPDRTVLFADWHIAYLTLTRDVCLLDLRGSGAMRAGTIAALAKESDRSRTQEWARYFYENPLFGGAGGNGVDGISYYNAHNDEDAFILFERAENAIGHTDVVRLDNPILYVTLQGIADENNLILLNGPPSP